MNYENLINRIKQNDNSAIMEFYNKFYKEVYYVCYKITENEKDAEDIAQETLIKAIDKIDTLKNPEGLSTWLKTIANNLSINYLKKNRKFNIVDNSEDMGEEIFEENRIAQKTPEDIVADKEVTDILTNMINRLPREQRITIFMFYYEELSVKEIAEIMDCSEATVRSRINYARKALRKQVDELENKGVKLRCIAILPFLFTVYSFEKTGVCAAIAMPSVVKLSSGMKGDVVSMKKGVEVAGEAAKMSLKAKIAIGAVAAVVLVGGTVGAVSLLGNNSDNKEEVDVPGLIVEEENEQETTIEENDVITPNTKAKYTMLVNGVEYKFPMTYEEFISLGWSPSYEYSTAEEMGENWVLSADNSGSEEYKTDGAEGINLVCRNSTENDISVKDCKLIGMNYDESVADYYDLEAGVVEFTDGTSTISIGISTIEEVREVFGEPTYEVVWEDNELTEFRNESAVRYDYLSYEENWLLTISFDENGISEYFYYYGEYSDPKYL